MTWRAISGESVGSRTDSTNVGNLNPWAGNTGPSIRSRHDSPPILGPPLQAARRHNLGYWRVNGLILRGWAMVQEGATEVGIALMCQNAANRAALGVGWYQSRYLCMLAAAYARVGQAEPGLRVIAEAKALVAANDEHMWEGELDRIEGESQAGARCIGR